MSTSNHQIILRERPTGISDDQTFAMQEVPIVLPGAGEVVLETLYVSVDPAMRVWIGDHPGYVEPVPIGAVMRGGASSSAGEFPKRRRRSATHKSGGQRMYWCRTCEMDI